MRPSAPLSVVLLPALLVPLLLGASTKEVDDGIDVYFRDADLGALEEARAYLILRTRKRLAAELADEQQQVYDSVARLVADYRDNGGT